MLPISTPLSRKFCPVYVFSDNGMIPSRITVKDAPVSLRILTGFLLSMSPGNDTYPSEMKGIKSLRFVFSGSLMLTCSKLLPSFDDLVARLQAGFGCVLWLEFSRLFSMTTVFCLLEMAFLTDER